MLHIKKTDQDGLIYPVPIYCDWVNHLISAIPYDLCVAEYRNRPVANIISNPMLKIEVESQQILYNFFYPIV